MNAHVIFRKKRRKSLRVFPISVMLTCGVAVTLYGQTCIYIYIFVYTCCVLYTLYCVYICVCFTRGIIYSAVLNLSAGCFAVYAKRINQLSQQGLVQVVAEDESVRDFDVYFSKLLGLFAAIG